MYGAQSWLRSGQSDPALSSIFHWELQGWICCLRSKLFAFQKIYHVPPSRPFGPATKGLNAYKNSVLESLLKYSWDTVRDTHPLSYELQDCRYKYSDISNVMHLIFQYARIHRIYEQFIFCLCGHPILFYSDLGDRYLSLFTWPLCIHVVAYCFCFCPMILWAIMAATAEALRCIPLWLKHPVLLWEQIRTSYCCTYISNLYKLIYFNIFVSSPF